MKFGIRIPSFRRRVAARTSLKRIVRHNVGLKMPHGWGWISNPKRALYNRVYNRTSLSVGMLAKHSGCLGLLVLITLSSSTVLLIIKIIS